MCVCVCVFMFHLRANVRDAPIILAVVNPKAVVLRQHLVELAVIVHRVRLPEGKRVVPFSSAFPMLVPSLSWQNDRLEYTNGSKKGVVFHTGGT